MYRYRISQLGGIAAGAIVLACNSPSDARAADKETLLEEVTVTASKRDQSLEDIPMSISVVGAESLSDRQLMDLNDFLPALPGVSFIDYGGGRNTIVLRGLAADPQIEDKVVGTYFGEANISQLGNVSGGASGSADLKMIDIARIELLRGPQGTLYGSGSMGGTLRILPNAPNPDRFEGEVAVGFSGTGGEGGANSSQSAVLNFPLAQERLALRLVGYHSHDSGYVRNIAASDPPKVEAAAETGAIVVDRGDIGATEITGWRASLLWTPSDALNVSLLYAAQDSLMDGRPEVNLRLDDYQQSRWEATGKGSEYLKDRFAVTNLTIEYDFGWAKLVSATSHINQTSHTDRNFLGNFWEFNPTIVYNDTDNTVVSEELRLVSPSDRRLRYVAGYFYEDFKQHREDVTEWLGTVESNIFDPNGSNQLGSFDDHDHVTQNAVFGELSYDVIENLALTVGGRYFDYSRRFTETFPIKGVFNEGLPEPDIREGSESDHTLKAGATYRANEDMLLFAQWAQGFRLGDTVEPWPSSCDQDGDGLHDELGLPRTTSIGSDSTSNYEIGMKWTVGQRLVLNPTIFHTDWEGIPIQIGRDSECGFGVTINGGKARTQGIEVEGSYAATDRVRVDFGASYIDAVLASDVEHVGTSGDRLPGSPRFSGSLGLQFSGELRGRPAFVRLDYAYVGGFYGHVGESGTEAGDYHLLNLNGSLDLTDRLTANVFVKNLTDSQALTWVDYFPPNAVQMRPRMVGINLRYAF